MTFKKKTACSLAATFLVACLGACEQQEMGPAEKAGKKIDETIEQAGMKLDEAKQKAGEKLEINI